MATLPCAFDADEPFPGRCWHSYDNPDLWCPACRTTAAPPPCGCAAECGDPDDYCPACRADYEAWLDAQADEAAFLDRYSAAPAGWTLEALAPSLN